MIRSNSNFPNAKKPLDDAQVQGQGQGQPRPRNNNRTRLEKTDNRISEASLNKYIASMAMHIRKRPHKTRKSSTKQKGFSLSTSMNTIKYNTKNKNASSNVKKARVMSKTPLTQDELVNSVMQYISSNVPTNQTNKPGMIHLRNVEEMVNLMVKRVK